MSALVVVMSAGIFLSLVFSLILSLSEASLLAVSPHAMQRAANAGDRRARLVLTVTERGHFLYIFIICNNGLILVMSTLMTLIVRYYGTDGEPVTPVAETIAHVGMVVAILVFGELLPKTYGSLRPEPSARAVAGLIHTLIRVLHPLVRLLTWTTNMILRVGPGQAHHRPFITAEEIQAAADLGEEEGTVEPEEGELLDSVMELRERAVRDIMVPRVEIVAMPAEATLEELVEVAVESGFSRIPVYEENIDHISGIVYVNDTLAHLSRGERGVRLADVARAPILAPETKRLDEMLWELREQKVHIAIIIDEFGATEGLVTIEDILEELVGEIEDEHDVPEPDILMTAEGEALVSGRARLEDLNEELGVDISTDDHGTVSGFIIGMAGRVPEEGEVVTADDVTFEVIESNDQYVDRLRVVAPPRGEAEQ